MKKTREVSLTLKAWLSISLFLLFGATLQASSVESSTDICMSESDAILYKCIPSVTKAGSKNCQNDFGEKYRAFHVSNRCSLEQSFELMGKDVTQKDLNSISPIASCLEFEVAEKYSCQTLEYEDSYTYCHMNFGAKYLPYIISKVCSLELADKEYGYLGESESLVDGLEKNFKEAESIMKMLDRQGFKDSFDGMASSTPVIENEFYTSVVKGLLSKLKKLAMTLEKRSYLKIKISKRDKNRQNFLNYIIRYQSLVLRIYRVYAYVAHRNHNSLYSYSFKNLDFLNFRIHKNFALEVYSQGIFKARTFSEDVVEFSLWEHEKQTIEYEAISTVQSDVDYAKLIIFTGIRQNLVNLWALDRMSASNLYSTALNSCGDFLNFRKLVAPFSIGGLKNLPSVQENREVGIFSGKYRRDLYKLSDISLNNKLIDKSSLLILLKNIYNEIPDIKKQIIGLYGRGIDNKALEKHFLEDIEAAVEDNDFYWKKYSMKYFNKIMLPGDDVLSSDEISFRISQATYQEKLRIIKESFYQMYSNIGKSAQRTLEGMITNFYSTYEANYREKLSRKLKTQLEGYENFKQESQGNLEDKIDETRQISRLYMKMTDAYLELKKNRNANVAPTSVEELRLYFESHISKVDYALSSTLSYDEEKLRDLNTFFGILEKKLKLIHPDNLLNIADDGQLNRKERSESLWKVLIESARDIYKKNNFVFPAEKISEKMKKENKENMRVLSLIQNAPYDPYRYLSSLEGKVNFLSLDELYQSFQGDLKIMVPLRDKSQRRRALFGIHSFKNSYKRERTDYISTGFFNKPRGYLDKEGSILYENIASEIDPVSLSRLYYESVDFTKSEIDRNVIIQKKSQRDKQDSQGRDYEDGLFFETIKYAQLRLRGYTPSQAQSYRRIKADNKRRVWESSQLIDSQTEFFSRVFKVFGFSLEDIRKNETPKGFDLSLKDQMVLVENEMKGAFNQSALLNKKIKVKEEVVTWENLESSFGLPRKVMATKEVERTLLEHINVHAYIKDQGAFDILIANRLIEQTIEQATKGIKGSIDSFCKADYKNYKNDPFFKKSFEASSFLRQTLKQNTELTPENTKRVILLDEKVRKNIRGALSAVNEDYLEDTILILGAAGLIALGVLFSGMSFGSGAPAAVAVAAKFASAFMFSLTYNIIFFSVIVPSTISRLDTQFIEVPGQIKFQRLLVSSQIDSQALINDEMIDEKFDSNNLSALGTLAFVPLDIYFGAFIGRQIFSSLGYSGVKGYEALTGIKLKKYTTPPKHMLPGGERSFRELKKDFGTLGAARQRGRALIRAAKMRLPGYQMLPNETIASTPLRIGLSRKLKELEVHQRPWEILEEVKIFESAFSKRFTLYERYIEGEKKASEAIMLNNGLKIGEVVEVGLGKTSLFFRLRSEVKAIKEGRYFSFRKNYASLIDELKHMQADLLKDKFYRLKELVKKIEAFKATRSRGEAGSLSHEDLADDFIHMFSDKELALLKIISAKSYGPLAKLRSVFKTHEEIIQSLRPVSYLYGHRGNDFSDPSGRVLNFLDEGIDESYVFHSNAEDIVNFYEANLKQHAFNDKKTELMRLRLENKISDLFTIDDKGRRVYFDL